MILLGLFLSFFQIGLFGFGGGLSTIPFIENLAFSTSWFNIEDVMNMIAISEATPGPLEINMATYVGFLTNGILGSIFSILGVLIPSIIIVLCIAPLIGVLENKKIFSRVFYGLRASSLSLIFLAFFESFKRTILNLNADIYHIINLIPLFLSIIILFLIRKFHLHPIFYLGMAAFCGVIFNL